MFANIPQSRVLLYAMLFGLVPLAIFIFIFINQLTHLTSIETTVATVQEAAYSREKKQAVNMAVRNNFRDADHFYIDKQVETLTFLEVEADSLQKIISNKNYPDDENIKKRLDFLTSGNGLVFTEGVVQSNPIFQETTETLVHPVEVNVKDIRAILAKVEGVQIGNEAPGPNRPQLIILDFKLDKKHATEKNDVFILNMKLLKREYL
jgi:hypothetical protein